jgi:hypothetical protein
MEREGEKNAVIQREWYGEKDCVSFLDALADVRKELWRERINPSSTTKIFFTIFWSYLPLLFHASPYLSVSVVLKARVVKTSALLKLQSATTMSACLSGHVIAGKAESATPIGHWSNLSARRKVPANGLLAILAHCPEAFARV